MSRELTTEFPGSLRMHMGLPVTDVERSKGFYATLLGVEPVKSRTGYAKFEPTEPSVNLSLNQVQRVLPRNPETHYGIQVKTRESLDVLHRRLAASGIDVKIEREVTCCYAVQDKIWVTDPDGHPWEVFLVLQADADLRSAAGSDCCSEECCIDSPAESSQPCGCGESQ